VEGAAEECRLWVASEWIIRCAEILYKDMNVKEENDRALQTGSLCGDDILDLGIKRWNFWKERFTAIAAEAEHLKLGNEIVQRISDAAERMEAVQKK
jgi:hypothetical protein